MTTHGEYCDIIEDDRLYVNRKLKEWQETAKIANAQIKYWETQADAISSISARLNVGGDSVFASRAKE